jgi:hypothetical protein
MEIFADRQADLKENKLQYFCVGAADGAMEDTDGGLAMTNEEVFSHCCMFLVRTDGGEKFHGGPENFAFPRDFFGFLFRTNFGEDASETKYTACILVHGVPQGQQQQFALLLGGTSTAIPMHLGGEARRIFKDGSILGAGSKYSK